MKYYYKGPDPNKYDNILIERFSSKEEMFTFLQEYCTKFRSYMFQYNNPIAKKYRNDISFRAFAIACSKANNGLTNIKTIPDMESINYSLKLLIHNIESRMAISNSMPK